MKQNPLVARCHLKIPSMLPLRSLIAFTIGLSASALPPAPSIDPTAPPSSVPSSAPDAIPVDIGGGNIAAPSLGGVNSGVTFDTNRTLNALSDGSTRFFFPADCSAAVGSTHFVSVVNRMIAVYSLATGDIANGFPKRLAALAGTPSVSNTSVNFFETLSTGTRVFDPRVIYDAGRQRWVMVALEKEVAGAATQLSKILIAVSATSNPTGSWHFRAVDARQSIGGVDSWVDFPNIAVDGGYLYITGNMFSMATNTFTGNRVWIANTGDLGYSQSVASSSSILSYDPDPGSSQSFSFAPAHVYGATGVAGLTFGTYLVATMDADATHNERFRVVRVSSPESSPTFTAHTVNLGDIHDDVGFPALNAGAPQLPMAGVTNRTIETGDSRPSNALWRNNRLYVANTVTPNLGDLNAGQATVRWYQFLTTGIDALVQEQAGNIGGEDLGAATATSWPWIAADSSDRVALSVCASSNTIYPGAYYTGRTAADPVNTMQTLGTLRAGEDFYYRPSGARNRWGDYTSVSLDPDSQSDFYVYGLYSTQQGAPSAGTPDQNGRWATQWGRFALRTPWNKNDFNNDGFADIVTQNKTSGLIKIHQLNGPAKIGETGTAPTVMGTAMQAVGDLNGDNKTDFIFKDSNGNIKAWMMNGTTQVESVFIYSTTNAKTTFSGFCAGSGDFNGDGIIDLVFQNSSSGAVTIWYMGNQPGSGFYTRRMATAALSPQFPASSYNQQRVIDARDYNGDGIPDLLIQNLTTSTTLPTRGNVTVYLMNAGSIGTPTISTFSTRGMSPLITTTAIKVAGTDDIDGDGLADITVQQGTAVRYYRRTIPTGQTVQNTGTFQFAAPQDFVISDTGGVFTLPSTGWAIRNAGQQ